MSQHTFSRIALAALVVVAGASQAQTVVDLQYSGSTCSFTTNSLGVTYDSNSGHLIAAATDANAFSGTCPGQAVVPTFSRNLAASPTAPTVNQQFTLSWATSNADYCRTDGTTMPAGVTLATWPQTGNICSTASACASPSVNVTATVSGSYNFMLQCYKNGNPTPATSSTSVTVSDQQTTGCESNPPVYATRQSTPNVKFGSKPGVFPESTHDQVFNDDPSTSVEPFPQTGNRSVTLAVAGGQYVALPFTVPAGMSSTAAGKWGFFDTNYLLGSPPFPTSPGASYSVSQCPGDFNVASACKAQWNGADGNYLTWVGPGVSDPNNLYCKLTLGKTYYLNLVTAPLSGTSPFIGTGACSGGNCAMSISYARIQ